VAKLKENTMAMPPSPKKSFKFVDVSPPEADDQLLVPKGKKKMKPKRRPLTESLIPPSRPQTFSEGGRPGDVRDDPNRGKTY